MGRGWDGVGFCGGVVDGCGSSGRGGGARKCVRRRAVAGAEADALGLKEVQLKSSRRVLYLDQARRSELCDDAIERTAEFYLKDNADFSGGACSNTMSKRTFMQMEEARETIRSFIGAADANEVVFTRSATEAINLIALAWGGTNLKKGDEIIVSKMEHHSNLVPWQLIANRTGAKLKYLPVSSSGEVNFKDLAKLIKFRTKILAFTHVSHVTGAINDVKSMIDYAKCVNVKVLIDACQSLPYLDVDVKYLGCDFLVGSGQKLLSPGGIGFLYIKKEILKAMPPFMTGGDSMFEDVSLETATFQQSYSKFEPGLPPVAQALALSSAVKRLRSHQVTLPKSEDKFRVDLRAARLGSLLQEKLSNFEQIVLYGPVDKKKPRIPICCFNIEGLDFLDVHHELMKQGVVVSAGVHEAAPLHRALGISGSLRVSLSPTQDEDCINDFIDALQTASKSLGLTLTSKTG